MSKTDVRLVGYDHADAQLLIGQVQQEYVVRYGGPDGSPVELDEFTPPHGHFVVRYVGGRPVAMGGWRFSDVIRVQLGLDDRVVELKRMYVVPESRGRGHARQVLNHLERSAATAGAGWMVLETGSAQPEAVALYRSAGYGDVRPFGHYADSPSSIHLGKRLTPGS